MEKIILNRIVIDNFRGLKHFDGSFGELMTAIVGDNATGKSSIFAAFTWCLFGKDELDRKDFEIKPCVAGKSQRADVSVEIHLIFNGHAHILRRVFRENWVRHKNEIEETFEGNETKCYWDDAPISVSEYKKRVADIVDESLFKMLTNPYYFPTMKWQDMRAALFSIAPTTSDEDIAKRSEEFSALLAELGGEQLRDFKARINLALKTLRKDISEIQPRIDEVLRSVPETKETRESVSKRTAEIDKAIAGIDAQLKTRTDAATAHAEALSSKRTELFNLRAAADKLVDDAKIAANEEVKKQNALYYEKKREIEEMERKLSDSMSYIASHEMMTKRYSDDSVRIANEKNALREEYLSVDAQKYNRSNVCPTCGQMLPEAMLAEAEAKFNTSKQKKLDEITSRGLRLKEQLENVNAEIVRREDELKTLRENADALRADIETKKSAFAQMKLASEVSVKPSSITGYQEAMQLVEKCKEEMTALESSDDRDTETDNSLESERAALRKERDDLQHELSSIEFSENASKRVAELQQRGIELAQKIADYEKKVFVATKFEQEKVADLEEHVNAMFHNVKWRLFDYTLDGNVVETCVPIVGNALYPVANSAAKINAGLDIIHTLSNYHGVRCPIFIDNAEGITNIESYDMQLVALYVEKDAALEIRSIK